MKRAAGAVVGRYARSLFAAACNAGALDTVRADVQTLSELWQTNREFALLIANPRLSRAKVRAILTALADRLQLHGLTRRFLELLLAKDRLEILRDIAGPFEALWRERAGEIAVTVITALEISEPLRERVRRHLAARSGRTPQVVWKHDPALLGGIVIEWPDRVFDGSLARKLRNLRAKLVTGTTAHKVHSSGQGP